MKGSAVKSDFTISSLPTFKGEKKIGEIEPTDEEQHLAALSKSAGWKVLKEYMGSITGDLDKLTDNLMEQGAGFKDIGQNAVVISLTKNIIRRVVNKVNDAREAVERPKGTKR